MSELIEQYESIIRLSAFFGIFVVLAVCEFFRPRRTTTVSKGKRWPSNIAIIFLNTFLVRIIGFVITPVGVAFLVEENSWGLLQLLPLPSWVQVGVAVILLDMAIYFQHVVFHQVPIFWRLHMVHHTDMDLDVTSALRFHPIEILLSIGIKLVIIALLGAPAIAVLMFEVLLNGTAMFNHSNLKIPPALDRFLRLFVVTPDMHRVHHSVVIQETNSNYGFNLPWWDYIFGTYRDQPMAAHESMTIGLNEYREASHLTLRYLLTLPFQSKA